jgi:hypothetical protein
MPYQIKALDRYRVDRADGLTALGPEKLVILVLKPNGGEEFAVAISKMDAMLISLQLANAASEVQAEQA